VFEGYFLKENSVQGVYAKSAHFYNIDMQQKCVLFA